MKKDRKPRKELPLALNVILVLMFVVVFLSLGVCTGFLINAFINQRTEEILANAFITLLVGIVYMAILIILIRNSDSENVKPFKWYVNCVLISFTLNLIITAITVFTLQPDNGVINYLVGFAIFPFIGICTTPNIVKHVKNDTSSWKKIFYKNGNLYTIKNSPDYYRVKAPVEFEKKILSAVRKHQILNVLVVIGVMLVIVFLGINYMARDHSYTDNLIKNLIITRSRRSFGFIFFMMIFFLAFAIPIIAYYVSNALKKIRVVRDHEYIAYHAIVPSVNNGRIGIYHKGKQFTYKYCTCVGIKEKEVKDTKAILVFVPDDVFLFPENEEYRGERYEKSN